MKPLRFSNGILLVVSLAAIGVLLVWLPPQILDQYERMQRLGPPWTYLYFALVGSGGAILLALSVGIVWKLWSGTRRNAERQRRISKNPSELSHAEREQEVAENLAAVEDLKGDASVPPELKRELDALASRVEHKQEAQRLEIVAFGTISSGKSSLLNALAGRDVFQTDPRGGTTLQRQEIPWPGADKVLLVDTPGLGEVEGRDRLTIAAQCARDADLVLMVVDGPLRDAEFQLLRTLGEMEKRVVVCLNKEDWYEESDRVRLIGQLAEQLREVVRPEDIVAVRSQTTTRVRVRVLVDGRENDERVPVPADIAALAERMMQLVRRDGRDLLLANLLLQSRGMIDEARRRVQEALDRRAWELVDRYTWAAAAAAALSPMPLIDLFAGTAITAKMVIDLAKVYRQEVDFNLAINLLAQLGKNLVAILGVNLAAPAAATAIASMLKTIPIAGWIAGGALQGVVQALVTRWIGAVFIGYFKAEMQMPESGLANLARREWQRLTSPAELLKFVQTAREKFRGKADEETDQ